ncbi:MAG: energy-coupling factor transporter ATPase [Eubacterium sp.]|nr:energy-coupling factor transporter ATPase [Eubacterium sp.]PWM05852.1 MAG: energy-coupling factor transporter ATPase [Clostridiales bacterium]
MVISIQDVVYEYIRRDDEEQVVGVELAVDHLSFEINKGEFIAVLGHNGSGKSTLAKLINAILVPGEGCIEVDGIDTRKPEMVWEIRQRAGMVFQNPDNQIVHNIVEEDVGFGPENLGVPTAEIWERVNDSLKKVGMYEHRKESPNNLSGGQKQRVAIAGVLAMKPKCIIFDESTAMLDPVGRREVLKAVHEINKKEEITILWVTHYMDEVTEADRVLVMNHGKVAMQGTPKQVFAEAEKLQEYHLAVPQVTELALELRRQGMDIPTDLITVDEFVNCLAEKLA